MFSVITCHVTKFHICHAAPATQNDGGGLQGAAPAMKIAAQLGFHLEFHLRIFWVSRGVFFGSHIKFHLRVSYEKNMSRFPNVHVGSAGVFSGLRFFFFFFWWVLFS